MRSWQHLRAVTTLKSGVFVVGLNGIFWSNHLVCVALAEGCFAFPLSLSISATNSKGQIELDSFETEASAGAASQAPPCGVFPIQVLSLLSGTQIPADMFTVTRMKQPP